MSTPTNERQAVLQAKGLGKRFGNVVGLAGVDLELYPGEVLAIIGDNGAGKSTLIKCLSGAHVPDAGEILVDGESVEFENPQDARRAGIETVYQNLAVSPALDIASNLYLGREERRPGFLGSVLRLLDKKGMRRRAQEQVEALGITTLQSMTQAVETLSGGQRQAVAIARTRLSDARIVLMDEPTAAISIRQVEEVLSLIRRLRDHGIAVILVSHRMPDVFAVADRVVVLRRGTKVADKPTSKSSPEEITGLITGAILTA